MQHNVKFWLPVLFVKQKLATRRITKRQRVFSGWVRNPILFQSGMPVSVPRTGAVRLLWELTAQKHVGVVTLFTSKRRLTWVPCLFFFCYLPRVNYLIKWFKLLNFLENLNHSFISNKIIISLSICWDNICITLHVLVKYTTLFDLKFIPVVIYDSDVPLPCVPDVPSYSFENLVVMEEDVVANLEPCYVHDCGAKNSKLYVPFKHWLFQVSAIGFLCYMYKTPHNRFIVSHSLHTLTKGNV